jgi:hypothetical protein
MFVFDIDRRQTFFFVILKARTPQEEHVKCYFSGHKQKKVGIWIGNYHGIRKKVASLCGLVATFLLSGGTGKGSCHHIRAATKRKSNLLHRQA